MGAQHPRCCSKRLAIEHAALGNFKSQRLVRAMRHQIVDSRIRCHFFAPLAGRPILCPTQQFRSNPLPPPLLSDVPAFYIPDGMGSLASISIRAQPGFQKTCQRPIACSVQPEPPAALFDLPPRINSSSCASSSAEDSCHSTARNRANWPRPDGWANPIWVSLIQPSDLPHCQFGQPSAIPKHPNDLAVIS